MTESLKFSRVKVGDMVVTGAVEKLSDFFLHCDYVDYWTYLSPQFMIEESQASRSGNGLLQLIDLI
ncbi:hypothetical protein Syun_019345 [Stephania yunnanensis]|uniref:Uncharacterized protein n=1 Tax=Stephania yunnanensis TaxID=152371 RepID=A0AAP0IVN5_9MAGN